MSGPSGVPAAHTNELLQRCVEARAVFTTVRTEAARAEAQDSERRRRDGTTLGALDGVAVAVKDAFDVAGTITSNGSLVDAAHAPAIRDAAVVGRLRRRGMVVVGKTTMSELAFSGLGTNPHYGTPVNPVSGAVPLVPGGSSSGSAVAVASGLVPLALGTDTSGSVRVPAAFCGIVGYKASENFLPRDGIRALAPTLDSVGVLGTSAASVRQFVHAVTPAAQPKIKTPRLVVPNHDVVDQCDPAVGEWFHRQVCRLLDSGATLDREPMPALDEARALMNEHGTVVAFEAFQQHGHYLRQPWRAKLDPDIARRLRSAEGLDVAPVLAAMARLRRSMAEQLGERMLICPTVPVPPPALDVVLGSPDQFDASNARVLSTTMVLSYLGMPGVSLPMMDGDRHGFGLLISSRPGADAFVLAGAQCLEAIAAPSTGWAPVALSPASGASARRLHEVSTPATTLIPSGRET